MNKKMTITSIKKSKGVQPLVMITAYDALFAKLLEPSSDNGSTSCRARM